MNIDDDSAQALMRAVWCACQGNEIQTAISVGQIHPLAMEPALEALRSTLSIAERYLVRHG